MTLHGTPVRSSKRAVSVFLLDKVAQAFTELRHIAPRLLISHMTLQSNCAGSLRFLHRIKQPTLRQAGEKAQNRLPQRFLLNLHIDASMAIGWIRIDNAFFIRTCMNGNLIGKMKACRIHQMQLDSACLDQAQQPFQNGDPLRMREGPKKLLR